MAVPDPARFDYLFEPIGRDTESVEIGDDSALVDAPARSASKRSLPWLTVMAAIILGAGLAMAALWSTPADAVQTPPGGSNMAPTEPPATPASAAAPTPESIPAVSPEPVLTSAPEPTVDVAPQPAPKTLPVEPSTPAARPPSPTVRSPMSVSPAPRPAFPNQQVPDGGNKRGGLLGRGGLL